MDICVHCKRWTAERDKGCRLCRLTLALSQVAGQPDFSEEDYQKTAGELAGILGADEKSRLSLQRKNPARDQDLREKQRDRSRDRRRRREVETIPPKKEPSASPPSDRRSRRRQHSPSPHGASRERKREKASPDKEEEKRSAKRKEEDSRERRASKAEGATSSTPPSGDVNKGWLPTLRPRESPQSPPPLPPQAPKGVVLKKARATSTVPEPDCPPRPTNDQEETEDRNSNRTGPAPSYPSGKGKGKGKRPGKYQKGHHKGKALPAWDQWQWGWNWDPSWNYHYPGEATVTKKSKGKKRDNFIGSKIEERRAKAKAKATAEAEAEREEEGSGHSVSETPSPNTSELPPPGTVIVPAAPEEVADGGARAKAKAVAAGPGILKRPAARAAFEPEEDSPQWKEVANLSVRDLQIGQKILAKVWYGGEEGVLHGIVREETTDAEGRWIGVSVQGTQLHQLRSFLITSPRPAPLLYLSKLECLPAQRLSTPGIGYLLSYREVTDVDRLPWMDNCVDQEKDQDENEDLRRAARDLGLPAPSAGAPPPPGMGGQRPEEVLDVEMKKPPKEKKLKGKQKVKKMVEASRWSCKGTPLDPSYKKPIKLQVKKKGSSSSSLSTGSSSSSLSSEEGLGSEHRLRTIAKRLPGYLCRVSAKEAKRNLAEATGETPQSLRIFHRYYRQVIAPRGGSRGLQREMMTLSVLIDALIEGDVLGATDMAAQRLKSLELMQQGSDPNLAQQIELIPREHLGMVADNEARYAQKQFSAEARLQRQLKGSPGIGKGAWSAPQTDTSSLQPKGKRKGSDKGKVKGKTLKGGAEASKIVPPQS
eukprot:s332_g26.t1